MLFYRAKDACMYVVMEKKAESTKDMVEEVKTWEERDAGAWPASPFSPSFSFC